MLNVLKNCEICTEPHSIEQKYCSHCLQQVKEGMFALVGAKPNEEVVKSGQVRNKDANRTGKILFLDKDACGLLFNKVYTSDEDMAFIDDALIPAVTAAVDHMNSIMNGIPKITH